MKLHLRHLALFIAGLLTTQLGSVMAETRYAYLAYDSDDDRAIRIIEGKRGEAKKIKAAENPAISPDGKRLLVTLYLEEGRRLAVIDIETGKQQQLPINGREVYGGYWSPDGKYIAFHILTDYWKVGVAKPDGSEFKLLGTELKDDDWFFAGWNQQTGEPLAQDLQTLVQLKLDGSMAWSRDIATLFGEQYISSDCNFWVRPDGKTLIGNFESMVEEIKDIQGPSQFLMKTDLENGSPVRISPKGLHVGEPFLNPNGERIVFTGFTDKDIVRKGGDDMDVSMHVYELKLEDNSITQIIKNAHNATSSR